MNREELREYLKDQANEILKYKWIESERVGYDIGDNAAADLWMDTYAENFRNVWHCRKYCPHYQKDSCFVVQRHVIGQDDKEIRSSCETLIEIRNDRNNPMEVTATYRKGK